MICAGEEKDFRMFLAFFVAFFAFIFGLAISLIWQDRVANVSCTRGEGQRQAAELVAYLRFLYTRP